MTSPYPRDLIGYGAMPPHAQWPGDAQIALQLVINYEEGSENSIRPRKPSCRKSSAPSRFSARAI
jgi:hypothetical protein